MNQSIAILCVEDEPEVREAMVRDLGPFADAFRIESAEDVADARDVLNDLDAEGVPVGLILCDHVLPGQTGVDFLVDLHHQKGKQSIRKVLITGLAGQDDTIRAINEADLAHYIEKPWDPQRFQEIAREQLTDYVLEEADDLLPYVQSLDSARLLDAVSKRRTDR